MSTALESILALDEQIREQERRLESLLHHPIPSTAPRSERRTQLTFSLVDQDGAAISATFVSVNEDHVWCRINPRDTPPQRAVLSPGLQGSESTEVRVGAQFSFADALLVEFRPTDIR